VKLSASTGFCSKFHQALQKIRFFVYISVWIIAGTHSGYVLELPDKKLGFVVQIALS
jgi:hypothetical protein